MLTLNERIKEIRKDVGMSQKDFAEKIGISQRSVSWGEQPGNNVPDSTVKSICMAFSVNEDWLRTGSGDMYIQPKTFSLNDFVHSHGANDLDLEILKAYFELDPDIRHIVVEHFKSYLLKSSTNSLDDSPSTPEELEEKFTPIDKTNDTAASDVG